MINKVEMGKHLNEAMMGMSAYALLQRAIPDLRDGFKPVNRRIITSMVLNNTKNFTKSATVEGRVMMLHPHGGSYGSMVGLVQKDRNSLPLLVGKGSWGQYTSSDHAPAAARYTEIKLGQNALEITKELKDSSVKLIPNYDGTINVPEVLPVTYPAILTQSQSGMAIGFASSILSYNIYDLFDMMNDILMLRGKTKTIYPDFPTGANIIKDDEAAMEIIRTGKGSLTMRSKIEVDGNKLVVSEIPYGVKREAIIKKIIDLNKAGKLKEVTDVRDGTSFKGMKIIITLKKTADPKLVIAKLYKSTPLEAKVNANMNVLVNGTLEVMGVENMLLNWIKWRTGVIKKGLENKLYKMQYQLHILEGLQKIASVDEAIRIIRFEDDALVDAKLMEAFNLSQIQAEYVGKMTLRSLNEQRIMKKLAEIEKLRADILHLQNTINNDGQLKAIMMERMQETMKAIEAQERKTQVIEITEADKAMQKEVKNKVVNNDNVTITITKNGWAYKAKNEFTELIPGDEVSKVIETTNDKMIIAFLNDGQVGNLKIDDVKMNEGMFMPTYFENDVLFTGVNQEASQFLLGFDDGHVVRFLSDELVSVRKIIKNGYWKGAQLILVENIDATFKGFTIDNGKNTKWVDIEKVNLKNGTISRGQTLGAPKAGLELKYILD